ncbi:PREDICTED: centrosomin isoform X1 [Papilio polytes]|uniref:centrosomin isoform X1 n=1 Tax=Papilio polytes TaxID=76194 RepID=UPI0006762AAF|nr:PREDICTED: centrosomin isoform X1 [Papilio polytes]
MATLPRMNHSKHGNSISSAFSTSPRALKEMTLPSPEGHNVTVASGVSMKQYEEQLNSLRKENFNLKLRIYFLEEKLGHGAPPAVQGLLEHNVRLQVEVEELRRQLSDKQELLAAAAEAIDVLEHQGSISTEGVETSMNNSCAMRHAINEEVKTTENQTEPVDDTYPESESAGDYLAVTVNNEDLDQLTKLRKENHKALQMIKGCMKKIQQQDKEIKKLKLDKELTYAHVSDSQIEKYNEILKCKDEHIKDLENRLRNLQKNAEMQQNEDSSGNLQQLLTRRLQGMAYFLDKLLSHKCVLGEDKKKLAESILEQSLALPVGLKLDETMAPEDFTMDESNLDISQSLRIEDLTMMFGHHVMCSDDSKRYSIKKLNKHFPQADVISESECWSEPDRKVSMARVGLCDTGLAGKEIVSDNNKARPRRSRISYGSRSEDNKMINESAFLEEIRELTNINEQLEGEKKDLDSKLEQAMKRINEVINEKDDLMKALTTERNNVVEANNNLDALRNTYLTMEFRLKDCEQQLVYNIQLTDKLRKDKQDLETTFMETERSLRRAADEATVQASQAALERARAQHDKLQVERELEEARDKLTAALDANAQLEIQLTRKVALDADHKIAEMQEAAHSEEDRPTSPDQGIDSDRLSSLEQNDAISLSPRSLYEENVMLKQKLARTKATLAETLAQLNAANLRKRSVQRAICREIHKTQGVLRKARDQFESHD